MDTTTSTIIALLAWGLLSIAFIATVLIFFNITNKTPHKHPEPQAMQSLKPTGKPQRTRNTVTVPAAHLPANAGGPSDEGYNYDENGASIVMAGSDRILLDAEERNQFNEIIKDFDK